MKDAVAYMDWKRVVPWKILSIKANLGKSLVPVGFGARNKEFYDLLEPRSQIWVVTRIANEFSLAGRLTVKEIINRDAIPKAKWPEDIVDLCEQWKFVARSELSNSEFFETNHAQPVLSKHNVRFTQSQTIIYHEGELKNSFRACMDQGRKTIFLSYRWEEGRRFAFSLAKEFRRSGLSPWFDAMAMPHYMNKGGPGVNEARLKTLIQRGIEKSELAVVINTEHFTNSPWTMLELRHIRSTGIPWFEVMRGGRILKCNRPPIFSKKAEEVAQEIMQRSALY